MTADEFRSIALSFPEATEESHVGHPDFRVRGKIFATLDANEAVGMVKLTPDQQAPLVRDGSNVFYPASGAWGRRGCTMIQLGDAEDSTVRGALVAAWRNAAPKRLLRELGED